MMVVLFLLVLLLIGLWVIVLPIKKKRPIVFTKNIVLLMLVILLFVFIAVQHILSFAVIGVLLLAIKFASTEIWLVIGITDEDSFSSLQKAMTGLQMQFQVNQKTLVGTQPEGVIHVSKLAGNTITITKFRFARGSKKYILLQNVYRKFIDNYTFRT